jgi:glutamyl-tRNA synthetase
MFEAFEANIPNFGHLSLVKTKDDKISKREGGFEIAALRDKENLEAMAINSFFSKIGSANPVVPNYNMQELLSKFDISSYSKSPTTYLPEELQLLNHKLIIHLEYKDVKEKLALLGLNQIDENFWLAVRPNLQKISDIKAWWEICGNPKRVEVPDHQLLVIAAKTLPEIINQDTIKTRSGTKTITADNKEKARELLKKISIKPAIEVAAPTPVAAAPTPAPLAKKEAEEKAKKEAEEFLRSEPKTIAAKPPPPPPTPPPKT